MKYFEPSEDALEVQRIYDFIKSCEKMPIGFSCEVPAYIAFGKLSEILTATNEIKRFAVINHFGSIELYRLRTDSVSKHGIRQAESGDLIGVTNRIIEVCKDYLKSDTDKVNRYAQADISIAHQNRIIQYSYLFRRLGASAVFRNYQGGATIALRDGIEQLIEKDFLTEIENDGTMGAGGKIYQIN